MQKADHDWSSLVEGDEIGEGGMTRLVFACGMVVLLLVLPYLAGLFIA
ncbi:MAG: hypothetical protein R3C52_12760 [Hyphomonadaceae bacterium]